MPVRPSLSAGGWARAVRHGGLRRYGANALWLMAEKAIRLAVGLTVGIWVARKLGPEQFGLLNYAISFAAMLAVFGALGLDSVAVRELVRRPERRGELLGSLLALKAGGFALMLAAAGGILWLLPGAPGSRVLIWVVLAGYFFQLFQVLDFLFQAEVRSKVTAVSQIAALLAVSAFRLLLVWQGAALVWFAAAEVLNLALCGAGYWLGYRRAGGRVRRWRCRRALCGELLREAWPFWLSAMAIILYMRIDQVMIGSLLGEAEVGCYAVAVRLVELFYFIPGLVCGSFLPALLRAREVSEEWFRQRLCYLFTLMTVLALGLIGALLLGSGLVVWLYGDAYAAAVPLIAVYAWSLFFVYTAAPAVQWYIVEHAQMYALLTAVLCAGSNIALNALLIPRCGAAGAAWASVGAYAFSYAAGMLFPRLRGITLLRLTAPFVAWRALCRRVN